MTIALQSVFELSSTTNDVTHAARGDRVAFGRLIAATQSTVAAITLAIVGERTLAQEIAQDVYLSAWSSLPTLRNPSSFAPWLRQLARNRAHDAVRNRVRARRVFHAGDPQTLLENAVDPAGSPARAMADRETTETIDTAIQALPDETREVVILYYREGRSVEQVAALLEIREELVRKRMSRAREVLRDALIERFGEALGTTAPGSEFSAAVLAALPSAGAASAGASAKVGSSLAVGGKAAAIVGGVGVGAALGGVPLWFGIGRAISRSSDESERIALRRFRLIRMALMLAFLVLWNTASVLHPPMFVFWVIYGFSIATTVVSHFFWLPKIFRERWQKERLENPVAGIRRDRRRRLADVLIVLGYAAGAWVIWTVLPHLAHPR